MNTNLLKSKLAERGYTQAATASAIGISLSRFNAKLNNADGAEFSLGEVRTLKKLFDLSAEQVDYIFFS
nr:MAG TPA: Protein of unknown function (DUF739) [Caudoviricetes sp.]